VIARLAAALAAAVLLAACGGDDGGRYDAQVDGVREAVAAGDREAALASLEELSSTAFAAHADGEVTDEELYELTGLVDTARAQLDAELPEPTTTTATTITTTTTTTTAPPTTPPAPVFADDDDDDDKGKKDKDNGRGDDDGDDDD
jgi:hypothetical protein